MDQQGKYPIENMKRNSSKYTARRYFPMLVSENGDEEAMSSQYLTTLWSAFDALPEDKKNALTADEMPVLIGELQEKFQLQDSAVCKISLIIRKCFFGEVPVSEIESEITQLLTTMGLNPNASQGVSSYIKNEILTLKPKPKIEEGQGEPQKAPAALVKLPLLQALSKYEQLGNQQITQERISVKSQSEPVRPSLLYWIKYYRDELGIGHHDSVQRGNFLFRSENGKRLSSEERERVNLVLKSIEENYPLDIDTERSEIVFPRFEAPRVAPQPLMSTPSQPTSNTAFNFGQGKMAGNDKAGALSFTSKHVFPAEKSAAPTSAPTASPAPRPQAPTSVPASAPKANPFRIRPVSLGKE